MQRACFSVREWESEQPCHSEAVEFSAEEPESPGSKSCDCSPAPRCTGGNPGALKYWLGPSMKASNIFARQQGTWKSQGCFFSCSMSQGRLLGWLIGLTAWLHNRQLWNLAALRNPFGRKVPEMHTEGWLNASMLGNVTVTKYPCSWTVIWGRRKRKWVIFMGNSGVAVSSKPDVRVLANSALQCSASRSFMFWDKELDQSSLLMSVVHAAIPQPRGNKFLSVERLQPAEKHDTSLRWGKWIITHLNLPFVGRKENSLL